MTFDAQLTDPRESVRGDPPAQQIAHPGTTGEMDPEPDHGEDSYVGHHRLNNRRALVTGGDSGIGRAVAIAFAREGAAVHLTHLPDEVDDAADTRRLIEDADVASLTTGVDLRDRDECDRIVDATVETFGGIDIVVNNAAYQMTVDSIDELTAEQLLRTFTTNMFATVWVCQAALRHLQPGGVIINTTSIQAYDPTPQLVDYAATKAALVNFTQNLATEVAERGIRVNSVAPGPVWTPLIPATMSPDKVEDFGSKTPLGRAAQPAELAGAYVYLACDESRYVTGANLAVTGGKLTA